MCVKTTPARSRSLGEGSKVAIQAPAIRCLSDIPQKCGLLDYENKTLQTKPLAYARGRTQSVIHPYTRPAYANDFSLLTQENFATRDVPKTPAAFLQHYIRPDCDRRGRRPDMVDQPLPGLNPLSEDHVGRCNPTLAATCDTSLSPRPERLTITMAFLDISGARRITSATACELSNAGMIPSNRANFMKAARA